eukprot:Skav216078  [mRNA]  locus=scaffold3899:4237:5790:+ [translate_table: standard]
MDNDNPLASASSRELSQRVPKELLQGVPIHCILARAGKTFSTNEACSQKQRKELKHCLQFDAFISHDWHTSRWLKYGSLLLYFNAKAAAVATLLVSIIVGVLVQYQIIPLGQSAIFIGYLTFVVVLLFWQNIRNLFVKPRLAFLDKLTIPQENEEVKETCILGLAGFLNCSQRLVVLFSESYIDRVWCVYEFATFMRIHGGKRPVQTIPVALPLLFLVHFAWWCAIRFLVVVVIEQLAVLEFTLRSLILAGSILAIFVLTYPCQSFVGVRMTRNLQDLVAKLSSFKVQEAKCHCCSSGHRTQSGDPIPCDRELIYQTFLTWYKDVDLPAALDMFNMEVRSKYRHQILETCGGSRMIPLDLFIYVVFSTNTPSLIHNIPYAFAKAEEESAHGWLFVLVVARELVCTWSLMFPSMLIYLWANKISWSYSHRQSVLTRSISAACVVALTLGFGFAGRSSEFWVPGNNWIPLAVHAVLMLLGVCLLLEPRCPRSAKDVPNSSPNSSPEKDIDGDGQSSFSI